jgi:hypothetical protein
MKWKVYFIGRAENGIAKSNHYKVDAATPLVAISRAFYFTEQTYRVHLVEITDAKIWLVTQEEWDGEDGYTIL